MKSPTTIQAVAAKRILYGSTLRQLHGVLADRGLRSTPENWDLSWSVGTIYTTYTNLRHTLNISHLLFPFSLSYRHKASYNIYS